MIFKQAALNAALALCFVTPSSMADATTTTTGLRNSRRLKSHKASKSSKKATPSPVAPTTLSPTPSPSTSPSESPSGSELLLTYFSDPDCAKDSMTGSSTVEVIAPVEEILEEISPELAELDLLSGPPGLVGAPPLYPLLHLLFDGNGNYTIAELVGSPYYRCSNGNENDDFVSVPISEIIRPNPERNYPLQYILRIPKHLEMNSCLPVHGSWDSDGPHSYSFQVSGPPDKVAEYWDAVSQSPCLQERQIERGDTFGTSECTFVGSDGRRRLKPGC